MRLSVQRSQVLLDRVKKLGGRYVEPIGEVGERRKRGQAATVLEYRHEGDCATDFDRMAIDGLRLRIDMSVDEFAMTTLVDDGEQLMHQVMHDSRTYMTMESDDDAVFLLERLVFHEPGETKPGLRV